MSAFPFDLSATVGQRVVALPTAAMRKVLQRARVQEGSPFPYIHPLERAGIRKAELIRDMDRDDAALALALSIFTRLDPGIKGRVREEIERGAAVGVAPFPGLAALLELHCIGEGR
jgi:hypothetical protein